MAVNLFSQAEPESIEEFAGNKEAVELLLKEIYKGIAGRPKPVLAYGPNGTGKTLLGKLAAAKCGLQLYELSPATVDCRESLEKRLNAVKHSNPLFGKRYFVLIDDVTSLVEMDRGAGKIISEFLSSANQIVYLTADDLYDRKLAGIRPLCTHIQLKKLSVYELRSRLYRLNEKLKIGIEKEKLDMIIEQAEGDMRAAINDLLARNENCSRDSKKNVFEALRLVFKSKDAKAIRAACSNLDIDFDMFRLWLAENIPKEYEKVEEIDRAYSCLSRSDIMSRRIIKRQNWKLLKYAIDIAVLGTAFAKNQKYQKFTPYGFPRLLGMMAKASGKRKQIKEIAEKLKAKMHAGHTEIAKDFWILKAVAKADPVAFSKFYGLEDEHMAFLLDIDPKKLENLMKAGTNEIGETPKKPRQKRKSTLITK